MRKIKIIFSSLIMTMLLGLFILPNISKVKAEDFDYTVHYKDEEHEVNYNEDDSPVFIREGLGSQGMWYNNGEIKFFSLSEGVSSISLTANKNSKAILTLDPPGQGAVKTLKTVTLLKGDTVSMDLDPGMAVFSFPKDTYTSEEEGVYLLSVLKLDEPIEDNIRPVIDGEELFVTNVDDAKPIEWFIGKLRAYDETDGDVSDTLKVVSGKDNYTANRNKPGIYEVTVEARDKSDNVVTVVIKIQVADVTAPIITGDSSTAKISYTKTWNPDTFKKTLTVSDNVDQLTYTDITLASKDNGYAGNETKLGTYTVTFRVKDKAGNSSKFDKKVQVIDDVKPKFTGPSTIATSNNTILTESDIRKEITAHDDIDGNLTSEIKLIEDNYTGNGNKVGSYTITYQVSDNAGNTATHTVTIERKDEIPPVIWVEDGVSIKTTDNTPLTQEQIIDILQATGQINVSSTTTFNFEDHDDYMDNQDQTGVYQMTVKARSQNGNEKEIGLSIWVLANDDNDDQIEVTPEFNLGEFIIENKVYFIIAIIVISVPTVRYIIKKRK